MKVLRTITRFQSPSDAGKHAPLPPEVPMVGEAIV